MNKIIGQIDPEAVELCAGTKEKKSFSLSQMAVILFTVKLLLNYFYSFFHYVT